jgi:hypothetical protein
MKSFGIPEAPPPLLTYADTHTFIVRIWQEGTTGATDGNPWRGLIIHVGSDRRQYFIEPSGAVNFIQEQIGTDWTPRQPWWQGILNWLRNEKK